jgi:hypothetical protein
MNDNSTAREPATTTVTRALDKNFSHHHETKRESENFLFIIEMGEKIF